MAEDHATHSRIPIVLGVTGHRDLHPDAIEALKQAVRQMFEKLQKDCPNTPLVLLSPLAQGADRLVAQVALELREKVQLLVPLPWPTDACPELPHSSGDKEEFNKLLAQATRTVPLRLMGTVTGAELRQDEDCRQRHWAQVGAYVARHSQLLIALWDGKTDPEGGTARMIQWQNEGKEAPFAPLVGMLDQPERGPVYHVMTPRAVATAPIAVTTTILYPGVDAKARQEVREAQQTLAKKHFEAIWGSIDAYNRSIVMSDPVQLWKSRNWLLPPDKQTSLLEPLDGLFTHYAQADAAAIRCQGWARLTLRSLFALVAVAAVCVEFYAHLVNTWWLLLAAYVALLSVAGLVYHISRKASHQERYLDYRALAEALRVQLFWTMAAIKEGVADHYLRQFRSELDWIRQAVRNCVLISGGHAAATVARAPDETTRFEWIVEHWIDDQTRFFDKKEPWHRKRHASLERWEKRSFWFAVVLAAVLLAVHLGVGQMHHGLAVVVFLAVVFAAMLHEWDEKSGHAIDAQRYQWMQSLFSTARTRIGDLLTIGDYQQARELVTELGREALSENADWVIQHRHRPIGLPYP